MDVKPQIRSIKTQIRNLQLGTIILLILSGCLFAIFIYSHNMRDQKIDYLENVLDTFYLDLITNNATLAINQADTISKSIQAHDKMTLTELEATYAAVFDNISFVLTDSRGHLAYASETLPLTADEIVQRLGAHALLDFRKSSRWSLPLCTLCCRGKRSLCHCSGADFF
jgi:hypothetical protein